MVEGMDVFPYKVGFVAWWWGRVRILYMYLYICVEEEGEEKGRKRERKEKKKTEVMKPIKPRLSNCHRKKKRNRNIIRGI